MDTALIAIAFILGLFLGYAVHKCEPLIPLQPPPAVGGFDPSSPGPIVDCQQRQWVAVRDDGRGPWIHDCVGE